MADDFYTIKICMGSEMANNAHVERPFRYTRKAPLLARRLRLSDEEDFGDGVTGDAENEESTEQH